jgi:cytochrome c oxidase subunit 3
MTASRAHALHVAVWIVIASEALLFAGLFTLYAAYRSEYSPEFHVAARRDLSVIGGVNTLILLTSSFFMAVGVHFARLARSRAAAWSLACVLVLGGMFLVLKGIEWGLHIEEGIVPGTAGDLPMRGAVLFFALYYLMTGLHAAHVIAGMILVAWVLALVRRIPRTPAVELVGLYWHFVDAIWVFLWPLFYLVP